MLENPTQSVYLMIENVRESDTFKVINTHMVTNDINK